MGGMGRRDILALLAQASLLAVTGTPALAASAASQAAQDLASRGLGLLGSGDAAQALAALEQAARLDPARHNLGVA